MHQAPGGKEVHGDVRAGDVNSANAGRRDLHAIVSRYEAILAAIPDIVVEVDKHKVYTWANAAGMAFFGDDVVGKEAAFYFVGDQDTYARVSPLFHGQEDTIYVESSQRRRDGQARLLAWWCRVLKDADGHVIGALSTARDITDSRQTQIELQESEERFRRFMDAAPDAFYVLDMQGTVLAGNKAAENLIGYERDELIGKRIAEINLLRPVDIPRALALLARNALGKPTGPDEFLLRRRDGAMIRAELRGTPVQIGNRLVVVSSAHDITDRARSEQALRESEEKYRSLVEDIEVGVYRKTVGPRPVFLQANRHLAEMFGYDSVEEFVAVDITDLYQYPEEREQFLKKVMASGHVRNEELRQKKRDGTPMWVLCTVSIRRDEDGNVLWMDGVVHDITERKKMEQDLLKANVRLSKALSDLTDAQKEMIEHARLSALGQMASGIAHDFNNALMPIVGLSELLLDDTRIVDDRKELLAALKDIHNAAVDAREVVRRLKEFYRKDTDLDFVPVDLNGVIERTLELTQPHWQEEMKARGTLITVNRELGNIPLISGHASQLRESFTNIILNAIDAMPNGGSMTIRSSFPGSGVVVVEFADTGDGMTSEVREHCLDPLFSTKGIRGSGMGLAVANSIVKKHGGALDVESAPGRGTTVRITFPLRTPELPGEAQNAVATPVGQIGPLRILVIEDDSRSSVLLQKYLAAHDHTVATEATGREGIERFRSDQFDLVLTDRAMPDMSGDKVARSIKDIRPGVPIIMLTGFGELMKDKGEIPDCVDILLSKPATFDELQSAIGTVMASGSGRRTVPPGD